MTYDGKDLLDDGARRARPRRRVHGVPVPGRDRRRQQRLLPQGRAERRAQASRAAGARRRRVHAAHPREGEAARDGSVDAAAARSTKASRAARRSATRSSRWPCSSRASRFSTKPIPASTSTRCASSSNGVNALRSPDRAIIVVTHYQRLLDYIVPDFVHVLIDGRIVQSGGKELALELEAKGYGWVEAEPAGAQGVAMAQVAERHETLRGGLRGVPPRCRRSVPAALAPRARPRSQRFMARGFPTTREEEWKLHERRADRGDRVRRVPTASELPRATARAVPVRRTLPHRVVLVNGRWSPGCRRSTHLPAGVTIRSLRDALEARRAAAARMARLHESAGRRS